MSIISAIKARWAASADLIEICPAEQFVTGERLDNRKLVPLAFLTRESEQRLRSNSNPEIVTTCRIQLFVGDHVDGEELKELVEAQFENTNWTSGTINVICSRIENFFDLQDPDDPHVWQFNFDIELHHWEA